MKKLNREPLLASVLSASTIERLSHGLGVALGPAGHVERQDVQDER